MRQPSEEEIRALEAEMERLTVDDVLVQTVVTLLNLGARKAGLVEGSQADLPQVKLAIEGARALLPLVEEQHGEQLAPVRDGAVAPADGLRAEGRRRGPRGAAVRRTADAARGRPAAA